MFPRYEIASIHLRNRLALNRPFRSRSKRISFRDNLLELAVANKRGVLDRLFCSRVRDFSVGCNKTRSIHFPLLGGQADQRIPRRRRCVAKLQVHSRGRPAAERAHVVGDELRVAHNDLDFLEREMEFFGDGLA
jgi:hypothetical protein